MSDQPTTPPRDPRREAILRLMARPGWFGTWEEAAKQLQEEDKSWAEHRRTK